MNRALLAPEQLDITSERIFDVVKECNYVCWSIPNNLSAFVPNKKLSRLPCETSFKVMFFKLNN